MSARLSSIDTDRRQVCVEIEVYDSISSLSATLRKYGVDHRRSWEPRRLLFPYARDMEPDMVEQFARSAVELVGMLPEPGDYPPSAARRFATDLVIVQTYQRELARAEA